MTLDDVRAFLDEPNRAVLATTGGSGRPHLVVVDFLVRDGALLLNGRDGRGWVTNLRRTPWATLLVHDPHTVEHWVRIAGPVELVREGGEGAIEDAKTLSRRYGDDPEQFNGQRRVTWRLLPERVLERTTG